MMTVQFTCQQCKSSIHVYPDLEATRVQCDVCKHEQPVKFDQNHMDSILKDCPGCGRKDFYSQKDFNRHIGVSLFIVTAIISTILFYLGFGPQWYLSTFIILYVLDFFLFRRLNLVAICYKCDTIFRNVKNISEIHGFDHEMHDRIKYADHDFHGKPPEHH